MDGGAARGGAAAALLIATGRTRPGGLFGGGPAAAVGATLWLAARASPWRFIVAEPSRFGHHEAVADRADELRDLLNKWDFIGVFDPENNTDEYDCMIQPLTKMLTAGADAKDIARFLDGEITGHFGMSPGLVETAPTAEQLTAWWRNGHP